MPWLTPDGIPAADICRPLWIPNDVLILAAVAGALVDLTLPANWEAYGSTTPSEIASAMQSMLDSWYSGDCQSGGSTMAVGALVTRTADQSWPYATVTAWQAVEWDSGAWDADYPDRLTAPEDGLYQVGALLAIAMTSAGEMFADLQLDGSTVIQRALHYQASSTALAYLQIDRVIALEAGQYVRVVHPTLGTGGTHTLKALAGYSPRFWLVKLSELE